MNKQKIIETLWGFISGAMTVVIIYAVKTGQVAGGFFASIVLFYTLYGVRLYD